MKSQEERDQAAADYFLQSNTPEALCNLGKLIQEKKVNKVAEKELKSEEERYQAAADYFLQSNTPEALCNLGALIHTNKVNKVAGKELKSPEERYRAAADYYRQSNTPEGLGNFGALIHANKVNKVAGKEFKSQEERYQAAADCYLKSNISVALGNLGMLIHEGKVNKVAGREFKLQEERDQAAIEYFKSCGNSASWYNLGLLYLKLNDRENAANSFHVLEVRGELTEEDVQELLSIRLSEAVNNNIGEKDSKKAKENMQTSKEVIEDRDTNERLEYEVLPLTIKPSLTEESSLVRNISGREHEGKTPTDKIGISSKQRKAKKALEKQERGQQQLLKKFQKWKDSQRRASEPVSINDLLEISYIHAEERSPTATRDIVFLEQGAPQRGTSREGLQEWTKERGPKASKALELIEDLVSSRNFSMRRGMPEKLKGKQYVGDNCWSIRLNEKDRVIYNLEEGVIKIHSFEGHYDD